MMRASEPPMNERLGGLAVALVSFADTSVVSRAYAARAGRSVDPNQEMVGEGPRLDWEDRRQ